MFGPEYQAQYCWSGSGSFITYRLTFWLSNAEETFEFHGLEVLQTPITRFGTFEKASKKTVFREYLSKDSMDCVVLDLIRCSKKLEIFG